MLFVNPALSGREITIRPSMEKFAAPYSSEVEIAEVFTAPRPMLLNKPLVQVLEHLGVPVQAFLNHQRRVVAEIRAGTSSINAAAGFAVNHSFGGPYRVPSILAKLRAFDVSIASLPKELGAFVQDSLAFARISMLREIKFEGRIPLAGCFTLVGGFDESNVLKEGEVFICYNDGNEGELQYVKGQVIVTRSPVVHPGDVRLVRAIGAPSSPFLAAQSNVIIFSGQCQRPVPNEAGGGDLDGDL